MTGTSQATAFVSGAAALLMSHFALNYSLVKKVLIASSTKFRSMKNQSVSGVILNVQNAAILLKKK